MKVVLNLTFNLIKLISLLLQFEFDVDIVLQMRDITQVSFFVLPEVYVILIGT